MWKSVHEISIKGQSLRKKLTVGLLIIYVVIILSVTVLSRESFNGQHFQSQIFWSYEVWEIQKRQIISNVLLFIPLGVIAGGLWKWKGIFVGTGISLLVELLQLISSRGLFEFDPGEILGTTRLSPYKSRVSGL